MGDPPQLTAALTATPPLEERLAPDLGGQSDREAYAARRSRPEEWSRPVDRGVSRRLSITSLLILVGSFDELAVDEDRIGSDEGDEVGCVDAAPAALG